MRLIRSLLLLGMLSLTAGCVLSLHPIWADEDIVFEPALVGVWEDDDETWAFSQRNDSQRYDLVYTDSDGKEGKFTVTLVNVQGTLFLNLLPKEPVLEANEFYKWHLLPLNSFAHVKRIEPTLRMSFPDVDWLGDHLEAYPDAIEHELYDGTNPILTASTAELQAFWLKHTETEEAFTEALDLRRKEAEHSDNEDDAPSPTP